MVNHANTGGSSSTVTITSLLRESKAYRSAVEVFPAGSDSLDLSKGLEAGSVS